MLPLTVGYVGCGHLAQKVHIPNLVALPEFELVAIAEKRETLGGRVRARYGVPRLYRDHQELAADSEIEAVAVSADASQQGRIAADLLQAGKHVFIEKPLATTIHQAEQILNTERTSGKRLMVAYMKRYDGGNVAAKQLIDHARRTGELGRLLYVRNHGFCGHWTAGSEDVPLEQSDTPYHRGEPTLPRWLPPEFANGYVSYLQQWIHNINLIRWLLDETGDVDVRGVDLDIDDGCTGIVVLGAAAIRAVVESGSVDYHSWDEHTEIYFERGRIKITSPPLLIRGLPATVEIYRTANRTTSQVFPNTGWSWSYAEELKHFARRLHDNRPFRSPASDAIHDIRAIEEIYRHFVTAAHNEPAPRSTDSTSPAVTPAST